jgi:hypothetical protein
MSEKERERERGGLHVRFFKGNLNVGDHLEDVLTDVRLGLMRILKK